MYILVLLLPILSFISVGLFGFIFGRKGSCIITTSIIGICFVLSLWIFLDIAYGGSVTIIKTFTWFSLPSCDIFWTFLFDSVTAVMLIVVTGISFLVHLYSTSYMEHDPHLTRFMSYLSLFTFFMLCLVTSANYLQLFLGWEGVGVSSYLLINFWFTRLQANKAALKAIIVNRFGDFSIIIALVCLYFVFNSFSYSIVFLSVEHVANIYISIFDYEIHAISCIAFFLFLGAVGKSAQLGLHTWLPDAMEGPTPVSALIHAATMVTAGVFLLIRSASLIEYSNIVLIIITFFGAITAFFAGTIGIFQNDLKRVIAYSTCSQLGYMVLACGLSNYSVALFHLMNHATFKALLFLSAGSVIHALMDEQDMRKMGGLLWLMPFTYTMFVIGSLALMGFPFTTGFYSKDVILELAYSSYYVEGIFSYWMGVLGACCTAFYSYRLLYLTFLSEANFSKVQLTFIHDAPIRMAFPLAILALCSMFVGFYFKDLFIGLGTDFFNGSIFLHNSLNDLLILEAEFIISSLKFLPVFLSIVFGLLALISYHYFFNYMYTYIIDYKSIYIAYIYFSKKWLFDLIYNFFFVRPILLFGYKFSFILLDRGLIELLGPTGLVRFGLHSTENIKILHNGFIFKYIYIMVISLIFFMSVIFLGDTFFDVCNSSLYCMLLLGFYLFNSSNYKI